MKNLVATIAFHTQTIVLTFRVNEQHTCQDVGGDLALQVSPRDGGGTRMNNQSRDYPFWTWFVDNPRPCEPPRR